jgi:hypothetical protein
MNNIPKTDKSIIREILADMQEVAKSGQQEMNIWLDNNLNKLKEENPVLYNYIVDRAERFAAGASTIGGGDIRAIALSYTIEQLMLLSIIDKSLLSAKDLKAFDGMMDCWLGKDKKLDGYDTL